MRTDPKSVVCSVDALTLTRSGQAASYLQEGKFDMVFFDLHMGSPDGMELSREMRLVGSNRTTPIILLSDDQRPSAMSQGFAAGLMGPCRARGIDILVQPFESLLIVRPKSATVVTVRFANPRRFAHHYWFVRAADTHLLPSVSAYKSF